jgi:hypothetical protein
MQHILVGPFEGLDSCYSPFIRLACYYLDGGVRANLVMRYEQEDCQTRVHGRRFLQRLSTRLRPQAIDSAIEEKLGKRSFEANEDWPHIEESATKSVTRPLRPTCRSLSERDAMLWADLY